MARQWVLTGQEGFETSLEYQTDVKIPTHQGLGHQDVLVKIEAASLNYRELVIAGPMVCHEEFPNLTSSLMEPGCQWSYFTTGDPRL